MTARRAVCLSLALSLVACAGPRTITDAHTFLEIAPRFRAFFPKLRDPDDARDTGIVRPRFGLPALARAGDPIELRVLQRGEPARVIAALTPHTTATTAHDESLCTALTRSAPSDAVPLDLREAERQLISEGVSYARFIARPTTSVMPGDYDLIVCAEGDAPTRVPRAVWLRENDPAAPAPLRIAQLSDLHIRRAFPDPQHPDPFEVNLRAVIANVNARTPDAVIITGDVLDRGENPLLGPAALSLLMELNAPVFMVLGNHDHGFSLPGLFDPRATQGWSHFAASFHPSLYYQITLGGWEFVGFDSGSSILSPRVLTRGLAYDSLVQIESTLRQARADHRRGVVLFSHAPTRARILMTPPLECPGITGQMDEGARELESLVLDAAGWGQRVIHLAGHTHWSGLFEAEGIGDDMRFVLRPDAGESTCPRELGRAALVTTQSSSHTTFPLRGDARGYGYTWLELDAQRTQLTFRRFDAPQSNCAPGREN